MTYEPAETDGALLTYAEAAERVGVKPTTIRDWVSRYPEQLPTVRLRGVLLVPERQLLLCERDRRRSRRRRKSARVSP